jgi:hypothetical protein
MKEIIALSLIYIVFFAVSLLAYKKMVKLKLIWIFVFIPIYIYSIYLYFSALVALHNYLRDRGIYFEFGHADLELILLSLFCFISAAVFVLLIFVERKKNSG